MHHELDEALRAFVDAGVQELANSLTGRVPDLVEFVDFRRGSFASYTAPWCVDLSIGARIPEGIRHTRTVSALLDAFMDHMGLANDIVSYQREVSDERDVNNLIVVLEASLGIAAEEAARAAAELVHARLRRFDHLAQPALAPSAVAVAGPTAWTPIRPGPPSAHPSTFRPASAPGCRRKPGAGQAATARSSPAFASGRPTAARAQRRHEVQHPAGRVPLRARPARARFFRTAGTARV